MIILDTIDRNHLCYLDVSAITGVFDRLVIKKACNDTQASRGSNNKKIHFHDYVKNIKGELRYEEPDSNIDNFNARLKLGSFPRATDITEENFIMRGATVKNIKCIYGLVVYTGMETKIMQILKQLKKNSSNIVKQNRGFISTTLKTVKFCLIGIYVLFVFILSLSLIFKTYKFDISRENIWYLKDIDTYKEFYFGFLEIIYTMYLVIPFTWLNLIGIAYYIMTIFIKWDLKILQKPKNKVDIINSDCLADFGQVRYILADKTGTLTSRKFVLKACSIKGKIYSFDPLDRRDENFIFRMKNYDISDLELYQELKANTPFSEYIREFFEYLCVCHNIKIIDNKDVNTSKDGSRIFGSSFAEEKSILKMLKYIGYEVLQSKKDQTIIQVNGDAKKFIVIGCNQYTDERKRMSVIVKNHSNDTESTLLCKGNDLSIFNYIKKNNESEHNMIIDQIHKLSSIGFRYFIFCKRDLSEDLTNKYTSLFRTTENFVLNKDKHFSYLCDEFECDMELLGVLFFEEKVSSDLRYSINKLNSCNINVWVVSGDRKENVMAVSKNIDKFKSGTIQVEFSETDDIDDLDIKMNLFLLQFLGAGDQMLRMKTRKGVDIHVDGGGNTIKRSKNKDLTILIHGNCFDMICNDPRLFQCFATLLAYTSNLFGYSFTPNNKFKLCQTLKQFVTKNSKVLAIGDGLNDFMMLLEADVSVGIRSKEILQVKTSCDVIVNKFPQIVDLILVHGTWNLKRLHSICMFTVYANFLIIFPFFLHQNSNPLGLSFFESNFIKLILDIVIINLTIIICFCFDQNMERSLIGLNPALYLNNFNDKYISLYTFFKSLSKGIIDSCIVYYGYKMCLVYSSNLIGQNIDVTLFMYIIGYSSYIIIYAKLIFIKLSSFNFFSFLVLAISMGGIIGITFIFSDVTEAAYQSLSFFDAFLSMLLMIGICYVYEKIIISFEIIVNPSFLYNLTLKFRQYINGNISFLNFF